MINFIKKYNRRREVYKFIKETGQFDATFYLMKYPEVSRSGMDPLKHYVRSGVHEGCDPNPHFSSHDYLSDNPDVKETGLNPFYHFLKYGHDEGRKPKIESVDPDHESVDPDHESVDPDYYDFHEVLSFQNDKLVYQSEYKNSEEHESFEPTIRTIAFYLPQYHPIPENDEAWGKGFTEWTNVTKALPQFKGHYQPRFPDELGYYDLRLSSIQKRQMELAKNYGISGFCYHYYWFNGKKVMDQPLQQILDDPELDFPFCVNWANENWTKRWDGLDNEIILKQQHSAADDLAFITSLKPVLTDPRYIKVDGKPLLMIYRPQNFPNPKRTVEILREYARSNGIGELFLILTHSFENIDPTIMGFDAATEFAPNNFKLTQINNKLQYFNDKNSGNAYDYLDAVKYSFEQMDYEYPCFRSICPSWDNEARKPGNGNALHNASPTAYKSWLEYLCYFTQSHRTTDQRLIFVNAWNEWAEAAYLEPDRKYGYAYLDATREVLRKFDKKILRQISNTQTKQKSSEIAVVLHLYYADLWPELRDKLLNIEKSFDLYINLSSTESLDLIEEITSSFPNVRLYKIENRGRDILPFIELLKTIIPKNYKYLLKIHSKKSTHREDGDQWRDHLIDSLVLTSDRINESLNHLDNGAGIVVAKDNKFKLADWIGSNRPELEEYSKRIGFNYTEEIFFPAGSMFWTKPETMAPLLKIVQNKEFGIENGQVDGTAAHAIERLFGILCASANEEIREI